MIDYFKGILSYKKTNVVVIEACGVGYSINITVDTSNRLPKEGEEIKLYIVEATGLYGGIVSHYGFLSKEEREMFCLIKDEVPSTGAKKAMEYFDKVSKSFADFKVAIIKKDISLLSTVFGFTKKTAEKLVVALKDKIAEISVNNEQKWQEVSTNSSIEIEAIEALLTLGYIDLQARTAVSKVISQNNKLEVAQIVKEALKYL